MSENDSKKVVNNDQRNNQQVEINEQRSRGTFSNNGKTLCEQNIGTTQQIELALNGAKNDNSNNK